VFIFDRVTGKPLFSVEERAVPQSDVPGEAAWPTQPFPTRPPPLVRQRFSEADITNVSPESHRYCADLFHSLASRGMYTPYGLKQTLVVPGTLGGATWSGGSFDPELGYLFVNVNELGSVGAMEPQPAGALVPYRRGATGGEYARFWDQNQWPCQNPPWGTLNAVDVNKGEVIWKTPLGVVAGLNGETGSPNLGGSVVTAGGLVFIGATADSRFRAFDSRSGKQLWVAELAASAHAAPVTYLGKKSRKQFVVVAAGGGGFFQGKTSDEVVAFALPN
jgi:glucose dehydrogenase